MFRGLFFIVFIINIRTSSCAIDALYETGQKVWKLYTIIDNRKSEIPHDAEETELLSETVIIRELEERVDEIHEELEQLEKSIGHKRILNAMKSWPLGLPTIIQIETIELFVQNIDGYYERFNQYRNESYCCCDLADVRMKEIFLTIEGDMRIIRKFVTNEEQYLSSEENLVAAITGYAVVHGSEICGAPQLISNIIIQLFRMIIIAELKTSTMLAYENIYGCMKNEDKQGRWRINSLAREKMEKQFATYLNMFSLYMSLIDGVYSRSCDPPGRLWTRNESFYELEKTFQATLFSYNRGNCESQTCNEIMIQKFYGCSPIIYGKAVLKGPDDTVAECAYLGHIEACILENGPYRFQYVNSTELGFLGRNSSCPKDNGEIIGTGITAASLYAACACNSYRSHNKISLLMIESRVKSNRVITGLRFVRENEVLYIQPREGRLKSEGYIKQHSQRWIPLPKNINFSLIEPINEKNRVFFLDDVTLPSSFALTGVKFNKVTRGSVSGFAIAIFGTSFNYKTGKLILQGNSRRSRQGWSPTPGKSLKFKAVSSVFTTLPHTVTPSDTKYVSLEQSTLRDDFGQSTLPLFDAVPITFEVPTALGGVGIFHKGVEGYAGLFSLRVYGIAYEKYFYDFKLGHMINNTVLFNCSLH